MTSGSIIQLIATFHSNIEQMKKSQGILFMDSGNYEAIERMIDIPQEKIQKVGAVATSEKWSPQISPDIAFSFDHIEPEGEPDRIVEQIVADFRQDDHALRERDFLLSRLFIYPKEYNGSLTDCAARIVSGVASELDPLMLAIPERELGDGLLERVKTVRDIRKALNALGKYYPLHLLGTGNPLSMIALATAGADSFDGLEWCRTVADYDTGFLFHFQQFDFFSQTRLHQIQDPRIRLLIENKDATYSAKTLGFNVDFFKDWTRTMQNMIHCRSNRNTS